MNWLSCREILEQETIRRESGKPLGWLDRFKILTHLALCRTCRLYLTQVLAIRSVIGRAGDALAGSDTKIREERREKIRAAMEAEAKSCACHSHSNSGSCDSK